MTRQPRTNLPVKLLIIILALVLVGWTAAAVAAQPPERVDVLIGFHQPPGPAEDALVRQAGGHISRTFSLVPVIAASLPAAAINALGNIPQVRYVELDGPMFAIDQEVPWGIDRVFGELYRTETWVITTGNGMAVAVLDTGIDKNHEDLDVVGGTNTIDDTDWDNDGHGHGTHVAGTIAALDNAGGVVGVAPAVALYAVKVLNDSGSGSVSSVVAGIEWVVKEKNSPVLNMSLGGSHHQTLEDACNRAYAAGHLLVAAAGNSGNLRGNGDNVSYPARYDSVIAVAASDINNHRAWFSSTGPAVELIAPGVGIRSTLPGDKYGDKSGTSMASPHVAGAAALTWAAELTLNNAEVRTILQSTAQDLGLMATHQGEGLVRADLAVAAALLLKPSETGSITGTVTDATNDTISGAAVSIEILGLSVQTDINGAYFLADVPVGTHTVTASATDYESKSDVVTVTKNNPVTLDFSLQPITTQVLKALKVTVVTDQSVYQHRDLVTITVTTVDGADDSVPVPDATVTILLTTANGRQSEGSALTDSKGSATFSYRVNANRDGRGTYTVAATATKEGYESKTAEKMFTVK